MINVFIMLNFYFYERVLLDRDGWGESEVHG